jgi:4-aminobutyrate aminotransferase-like enzyme
VVAAVQAQAARLIHGLGDAQGHPLRVALAARLARRAPLAAARVAFAVSGADAVELAVKTALLATGRRRVVAFAPAYHGVSLGALALSSRPRFRAAAGAHLHRQVTRLPFGAPADTVAAALGAAPVAAVVVEPIVGREGVLLPPAGWLVTVAELCRRHGALLVVDEILTGCGRTGRWFAVEHDGVEPDLLCCGKALGGGLPIAAVVGRQELMAAWDEPGEARHTATFVAQPLACAAALATLDVLEQERLVARAARLGRRLEAALADWPQRFPAVREIRGRGALWGIEWQTPAAAAGFAMRARHRGILLLAGGATGCVAQLLPPLTITERQLGHSVAALAAAATE